MANPAYLQEYLSYLDKNPNAKPIKNFVAVSTVAQTPPNLFNSLPYGDVFVYPQFLAFLTLDQDPAGAGLFYRKLAEELTAAYNVVKWIRSPETIILDAAKWLSKKYQNQDTLAKALANPNSIFVPFDKIKGVETGSSWSQGFYIKIRCPDRTVLICQTANHENSVAVVAGMFTGKWQADVVTLLKNAAK